MKKPDKTKVFLVLATIVVLTSLSIAAFNYNSGKTKDSPSSPKKINTDGPIKLKSSLDNNFYYDGRHVYLYVDLNADRAEAMKKRTPLNISVVIDRSGSMADKNKLAYVKKSVEYIIDQLNSDDYISIVTYDDQVDILQRSSRIRDKYELRRRISRLEPGGFTNLSEGMFEGYDQVDRSYRRGYVNRVLLLSDGLANRGITDRFELADIVRDKNRRDGIVISTFGVGNDFNEDLMADIAEYGKGNYYYIRNSSDIPEIFANELKDIRNLVGQATKVRVRFNSGYLRLNNVFGYPYEASGDVVTIDFKDVFSGQNRSVLIKFDITRPVDGKMEFESELSYEDVSSDFKVVKSVQNNQIEPVYSRSDFEKGINEEVMQNVALFESNEIMEKALREADRGNYEQAKKELLSGKSYMKDQMDQVTASPEMRRQLESMERYENDLESAETKSDEEKKEMQKSGKYDNYNSRKKNR